MPDRFEASCFDGDYVTEDITPELIHAMRAERDAVERSAQSESAGSQS
jgi:hypothetical protein